MTATRSDEATSRGAEAPAGDPSSGVAVRFDRVTKRFADGTLVLEDFSLDVPGGEIVSLVGPSGCGKSTLLRLASSLSPPTSGQITIDRDRLGYVFQDPTLLPWRTVRRNVELLGKLHGVPRAERRARAEAMIELTGLTGFANHYPRALSGGMKMRASLARSLTLDPAVFLFDEPFGALDEITRERLNTELLALYQSRRFTGLFVTHSVGEAAFLSSRVIVLSARPGRIVADVTVPFGYPRDQAVRFDPEFVRVHAEISDALREGHR